MFFRPAFGVFPECSIEDRTPAPCTVEKRAMVGIRGGFQDIRQRRARCPQERERGNFKEVDAPQCIPKAGRSVRRTRNLVELPKQIQAASDRGTNGCVLFEISHARRR